MKEKLTSAERRHKFALNCTRVYAGALTRLLFGYHGQRLPKLDGPVFIVSNHNTDIDCVFLGMAAHGLIYFVATETLARMGFAGRFLMYWFDPILHSKGTVGTATSRAILSRLRAGHSVGLFPEGNRSFNGQTCPIPPATGKLAKLAGATLVTYRLTGGYFTTPQVGQRMLAAALNSPISVMSTAGEGGAWGIALLASYAVNNPAGLSLADYLDQVVFAGNTGEEVCPTPEDVAGFNRYIENYKASLPVEQKATECKK